MRLDADKLIESLLTPSKLSGLHVVLSDLAIVPRLVEERFKKTALPLRRFEGKQAIAEFVEAVGNGSLFGDEFAALIELSPKLTEKQWKDELPHLARLPSYSGVAGYFIGPTALRHAIKETKENPPQVLCYSPSDAELGRCVQVLLSRYPNLKDTSLVGKAIEQYANDLVSIDLHFDRMNKSGGSFEQSTLMQTDVNAFSVVDALVKRDKSLIELRLKQCESAGEEVASVFMAIVFFMRQLTQVRAGVERSGNIKRVFDDLRIPYPSQARMQVAVRNFKDEELSRFFMTAAKTELALRKDRQPFQLLGVELIGLIS